MSTRLGLQFLGLPQILLDGTPVATDRRKAVALLAYLVVNDIGRPRQKYSRELLSALFWPDYDQAKAFSNLRRTIWEIHQAVGEHWLIADHDTLQLNADAGIDLDVAQFKDLLSQSRAQKDVSMRISLLADTISLYRNHFLTGFSLKDASAFNEWAYAESEELRRNLAEALTMLVESHCSLKQAASAIPYARRLISLDPLNESSQRQLMEVYIQAGQHSAALKQYQTCEQILRKELNLDPQPETRALYKKIRKGEMKTVQVEKTIEPFIPPHNLPAQLSTFVGREKEQAEVISLLRKNRLVTLAGMGGIGKTRLSLQVGERLLNEYPNGVWFIAFDSLSDPALVPQTVASVFDIREGSGRPILERIMDVLRNKTSLLMFDNCEHILDACGQLITTLLTNCPNLKVLATSREVLNVAGEATYHVPSLSLPEHDDASLEKLNDYESIRLFVERAALASSSFALTREDAQTIVDICRMVDGIPLAIELAATRVNMLQVAEILIQLQSSFALLSTDKRMSSSRHQTLQASLDWSWGLLNEAEQRFMRQLAVFAGGWTLESAQAICGGDVLSLTDSLVKKSLIGVKQETGRETRYRFHEIVRQYVGEKLVEAGEKEIIRARHLKYFLQLSEQREKGFNGIVQLEWYVRLIEERDNFRAALEWAEKTDMEAGLFISGRLGPLWQNTDVHEGMHWLTEFLQKPESKHYPLARAKALLTKGWLLNSLYRLNDEQLIAQECLQLYRDCGDQHGEIDGLMLLAYSSFAASNQPKGIEIIHQALELARSLGDAYRESLLLVQLSVRELDFMRALPYLDKAIGLHRQANNWDDLIYCLSATGARAMVIGKIQLAEKYIKEAVVLLRQLKDKSGLCFVLRNYGRVAFASGWVDQAFASIRESIELSKEIGNRMGYLWSRSHLGYFTLWLGDIVGARAIFSETAQEFISDNVQIGVVFNLEGMASFYVVINKVEHAARLIGWADATREKIVDTRHLLEQAEVDKIIAACQAKMGEGAFSDAYEAGQKMTLDEAVALALENN